MKDKPEMGQKRVVAALMAGRQLVWSNLDRFRAVGRELESEFSKEVSWRREVVFWNRKDDEDNWLYSKEEIEAEWQRTVPVRTLPRRL